MDEYHQSLLTKKLFYPQFLSCAIASLCVRLADWTRRKIFVPCTILRDDMSRGMCACQKHGSGHR